MLAHWGILRCAPGDLDDMELKEVQVGPRTEAYHQM